MFLRLYLTIFAFIALSNLYYPSSKIFVICIPTLNGRYTADIEDYKLTVPFKAKRSGEFSTFQLPHFYKQNFHIDNNKDNTREKRSLNDPEMVHYSIEFNNEKYLAELWPNHGLISPNVVVEHHQPDVDVKDRIIRRIDNEKMCHFTGRIKDMPNSRVALSTCDGLAGYIQMEKKRYFIEPVEDHVANSNGQHLHVMYERYPHEDDDEIRRSRCGTSSNWEDAWRRRFYEKYRRQSAPYFHDVDGDHEIAIEKRGSESVHRYLETLVVCDKKFLSHHQNIDVQTYVLTIMNMVADFYHDYSSGNQMDVVVVRIIYLDKEEEEIDLVINPNAEDTLASFCKWQEKINPKDLSNPNHHDIAVLLTRYDICAENLSECGLMGLAYVASACTGNEPCAINEDAGLVLGIVVAHEMGHVMGCAHDKEGESSCAAKDDDDSYFVMAPYVHLYTTRWSSCSKGFITSLFENGLGDCLNDEPEVSLYKTKNVLPGVVYDADAQCNMAFPGSKLCSFTSGEFCQALLCETKPDKCTSNGEPPADGTKCGSNMWCYKKKCVEIGERPEAIDGGWGKWGAFSDCSRTCGGGVSIASRECDNPIPEHGGRYCLGDRKKVKTCNMDPCPVGSPSFREIQCKDHDTKPFNGKLYQWKAYFKTDEPCVLYCLSNENIFAKLEPRAKDGTKCKPGSYNMCIGGYCKKIGCDGEIDSDAEEDICGVCNGDGTQCKMVDETYTQSGSAGYTKVAVLPAGCRNVLIEEMAPSVNTLAISDISGKNFYLNGNKREQRDGPKQFGEGVEGVYSHPEPKRENLIIHGPLAEDLVFHVVFYRPSENVGYHYKYAEPNIEVSYTPKYQWEVTDWEDCSVKCGGGVQNPKYTCIEAKAGKVSASFCESLEKPTMESKPCNEQPCKTKWKLGKWSKCRACKYKSGVRSREVECVQESPHPGEDDILLEDKKCTAPKPGTRELCNSNKKCKTRRNIEGMDDGLSDELMEDVWRQIYRHNNKKRSTIEKEWKRTLSDHKKLDLNKKLCHKSDEQEFTPKLDVGKIVKDPIPKEEIKLIEVPLKQSHLALDLSDESFETMGDKVGDTLDTDKAKIITGKAAGKIMKKMENDEYFKHHKNLL